MVCDNRDPIRTKFVLMRDMKSRGILSCMDVAVKDDNNSKFLSNPVCERHMDDLWLTCRKNIIPTFFALLCIVLLALYFGVAYFTLGNRDLVVAYSCGIVLSLPMVVLVGILWLDNTKPHSKDHYEIDPHNAHEDETLDQEKLKFVDSKCITQLLKAGIDLIKSQDSTNCKSCNFSLRGFLYTPYNKFLLHGFAYTFYMSLFLFLIMTEKSDFAQSSPGISEGFLFLYWISIFLQEIREFMTCDTQHDEKRHLKNKVKHYFASQWNRFDTVLFLYLIILLSLRIVFVSGCIKSCNLNSIWLLNLYTFYFILWCCRFLQLFSVSRTLGPKLMMIRLMLNDLGRILLYISMICFAYSSSITALIKTTEPLFFNQTLTHNCILSNHTFCLLYTSDAADE